MPAPTPITIRYGPSGLLGQAAALAPNPANQQRDFQFLMSTMQQHDAMQQSLFNNQFEANKLQLAHGLAASQAQPAPDPYAPPASFGSDTALKTSYFNAATALPDDQKPTFQRLIHNPHATPDQYRQAIENANKGAQTDQDEQAATKEKVAYLNSATQGLDPADVQSLQAGANDKKTTFAQLRSAVDAIKSRNRITQQTKDNEAFKSKAQADLVNRTNARAQRQAQAKALDEQIAQTFRDREAIRHDLVNNHGFDPLTSPPAAMNPTYVGAGDLARAGNMPGGNMTTPAGYGGTMPFAGQQISQGQQQPQQTMNAYVTWIGAQKKLADLQNQRAALGNNATAGAGLFSDASGGSGGGDQNFGMAAPQQGDPVQVNTPEEAMSLPSGTTFLTPDGRLKVRP